MKGTSSFKSLHLQSVSDLHSKRTNRDHNASVYTNSRPHVPKTTHNKNSSYKENLKIDLKEGLHGGFRFDDSHFKAILRNSNCSSVKNLPSSRQIQYCFGSIDRGICSLSSTMRRPENTSRQEDFYQSKIVPPIATSFSCQAQKVRENREKKFIPQASPTHRIVTHPGEYEVRRHSMAPPNQPYGSPRKNNGIMGFDSPDRYYMSVTEPAQVSQGNKFTFLGALTTHDDSYNEADGTQTSRFPENVEDGHSINYYELNSVVAQEDFQIDVKFSKEKNLLPKMSVVRESKNRKNPLRAL